MKLTKDQKYLLNISVDRYMATLKKINDALADDLVPFDDKKDLLNMLDCALAKVWIDYSDESKQGGF